MENLTEIDKIMIDIKLWHGVGSDKKSVDFIKNLESIGAKKSQDFPDEYVFDGTIEDFVKVWKVHFLAYPPNEFHKNWYIGVTQHQNFNSR